MKEITSLKIALDESNKVILDLQKVTVPTIDVMEEEKFIFSGEI